MSIIMPDAVLRQTPLESTHLDATLGQLTLEEAGDKVVPDDVYDMVPVVVDVGAFELDENVLAALPVPDTKVISATKYGQSLWGPTAKIVTKLPDGERVDYFLKVFILEAFGKTMSSGEFESLRVIYEASPGYCPKPFAHGRYAKQEPETYFLLMEFREFGKVPADPEPLARSLADMHKASKSPTGKFGFHTETCYSFIPQDVAHWDDSWCVVFKRHLQRFVDHGNRVLKWPEWDVVAACTIEKVVPRLLLPLQDGRELKPCLAHGDCWDGNTAMDARTGKAMIFDVCTFYAHNEYDIGNWRAPRHRLSKKAYIKSYKKFYQVSAPAEDWDDRNLLYSLPYNIASACYVPGSDQRPVIYDNMETLCKKFCPELLEQKMQELREKQKASGQTPSAPVVIPQKADDNEDDEEEEEEEEEEEQSLD